MSDTPHRRAEDLETAESNAPEPSSVPGARAATRSRRNARDFFRKVKQPLIGLGLAGAATPMIQAGSQPDSNGSGGPANQAGLATDQQEATAAGADLEETIATRIGEARATAERDEAIAYAIDRYDIDQELAQEIFDAAAEAGVDAKIAYGLVKTESSFKNTAVSHVGARGLTQVMPRTANWLRPGTKAEDLYDKKLNLSLGFFYLNKLVDKYDGDLKLALTAYNRGPGTVDRVLKKGGNPDNGYAGKVIGG